MMYRLVLVCILLVGYLWPLQAQDFRKAFLRISADDGLGLNSNTVTSLYQDENGYLWVGTANGIQRFDGTKFIQYDTEKPGSERLPDGQVEQLAKGPGGRMWMMMSFTYEIGLFDPRKVTFHKVPIKTSRGLPPRSEFTLWTDSKGDAYINILRYGRILKFDPEKFEFNENTPLNNLPKGWKSANNVFEDTLKQQYWIIADSGLCVYDRPTGQMWHKNNNPRNIPLLNFHNPYHLASEFFIDSKRRFWYFFWTGSQNFYCFDEEGNILIDTSGLQGVNTGYAELRHFLETRNGSLWIYGPGCLYSLDSSSRKFTLHRNQYTDNYNIRYQDVNHMLEDRDGLVWIATDQGLYYHAPRRNQVANYFLSEVPGFYEVTDLLQLRSGDYWIGTWGKGVITGDKNLDIYPSPLYGAGMPAGEDNRIMYRQVWSMLQHSNGKVYIGCQRGRLMVFDPATRKTTYLHPPEFDERTIRYITEDAQGNLWFGTQSGRVLKYDGNTFQIIYNLEESAIIYKLLIDRQNGWVWLATHERGLYALHPESGKVMAHYSRSRDEGGLWGNWISDMEQLNDSTLYVTASGVLHIINKNSGNVQLLTTAQGLPSNTANRIRLDAKGYLWIVTKNGLCHYDWRKGRFTSFGKKDGLFLGDLVDRCDLLDNQNNVLFAGPNSLVIFNPDVFYNNPPPPPVFITDFKLLNTYLPVDSLQALRNVRLGAEENSFTIYFSSLSFRNRGQFTYYYKLEGADKDWVRADESQSAQYRLLPPGHYVFKVRVENLDGVPNESITTMAIFVKPHFWQTGWFISTLLVVMAMVAYGMHRLRLTRILAVEKIRARVSRDLHDDMGSTLSTINILSSMAKAKIDCDVNKAAEYIGKIGDNSQRMMEAMDDIVWAIKPDNDTMLRLIARMREFATNVLEAKDITIHFTADEALNDLKPDMEARRDLFLLFKEAVNNAAKYSKGTDVTIEIGMEYQKIKLKVEDNGVGFDINSADSGNGLGNMQRRAAALRGNLKIQSQPGKGTTITLLTPLTTA